MIPSYLSTGCCEPNPTDCYCADPSNPANTDSTIFNIYSTISLPCVWTAAPSFGLVEEVSNILLVSVVKTSYKVNESILMKIGLVNKNNMIILNAENQVSAQLIPEDFSVYLIGAARIKSVGGYAEFTDLAVIGSVGFSKSYSIKFSAKSSDQSKEFSIISSFFVVSGGDPRALVVDFNIISSSAPSPDFQASVIVNDAYGNRATVKDGSAIYLSSVSDTNDDPSSILQMEGYATSFSSGEAQFHPKIQPSKSRVYLLRFSGLGLTVDRNFTIVPGYASKIKVSYIDPVIVAWETFKLETAAVDDVGNILYDLGTAVSLFVSVSTMQGIEVLGDHAQPGCTAQMLAGVARFRSCSVRNVDHSATVYPRRSQLLLSFCPTNLVPCPTPLSSTFYIQISPPVYNITSQVCLGQDLCSGYYGQQTCPCSTGFQDLQVANEFFFGSVIAQVYDSSGRAVTGSQLLLSASLEFAEGCVELFGDTVQQVSAAKASWTNIGPLLNTSSCNPKMSQLDRLRLKISVSNAVANYDLYSQVTSYIPLHLDFPASYLKIETSPEDTTTGEILFPPPRVGLYAIMFSYPCWKQSLENCVQPVPKTVRFARIEISPIGYTSKDLSNDLNLVLGKTSVPIIDGLAEFTDLAITRVGVYNIQFTSYSYHNNISSTDRANITIRVGEMQKVLFLKQPQSMNIFQPQSVSALLLDNFNNRLSCDLDRCPSDQNGYPALVNTQAWPTLESSDLRITARTIPVENCSSSSVVADSPSNVLSSCLCQQGKMLETRAVRAVGTFCSFSATSIGQFVLQISVGAITITSNPFVVYPGEPKSLIVKLNVDSRKTSVFIAGLPVDPPIIVEFVDSCNNLANVGSEVINAGLEASCFGLGLSGDIQNTSIGSRGLFTNLRISRVLPSTCRFLFESIGLSCLSNYFSVHNANLSRLVLANQPQSVLRGGVLAPSLQVIGYDPFGNLVKASSSPESIVVNILSSETEGVRCSALECDSTSFLGRCYKAFEWPSTWTLASQRCRAWGGALASVTSSEENDFVARLAQGQAWIGLSRQLNSESAWFWDDLTSANPPGPGSNETTYANWNIDETSSGGNCGAMNAGRFGLWGVAQCSLQLPFVCGRPKQVDQVQNLQSQSCSCKALAGQTTKQLIDATATFQDLSVIGDSTGLFRLLFSIISSSSIISVTSEPFAVISRTVQLKVWRQPGSGAAGQPLAVQPLVLLLDSFGNVVMTETLVCSAKLLGSADGSVLLQGDVNVTSKLGSCEYQRLFVNATQNLGFVIQFTAEESLSVISQTFYVSQTAISLAMIAQIPKRLIAGDAVSPLDVYMLNLKGASLWQTCVSKSEVSSGCIVTLCSDIIEALLIGSKRNNSLVGKTSVTCKNGVAKFTNLSVIEAGDTYYLEFFSLYTNLIGRSGTFMVHPRQYSSLVYIQQPSDIQAGKSAIVVVALVDVFMNRVLAENVTLRTSLILANSFLDRSSLLNVTRVDGTSSFAFYIVTSGFYSFRIAFEMNSSECQHVQNSNATIGAGSDELEKLCDLRHQTSVDSNLFQVRSGQPASISISKNVSVVSKAGMSFAIQPACEVRDIFGNLLFDRISIQARVENEAGGCLCDLTKDSECTSASTIASVQVCEGLCPVSKFGTVPNISAVQGIAKFQNLACTKASCIPGCTSCGLNNCNRPYRFICSVLGGLCSPCVAKSNFFDVVPNDIFAIFPGQVQIVVAGSPSRGIDNAGFYRSKYPLVKGPVLSGANFSTNSLERYSLLALRNSIFRSFAGHACYLTRN